MNILLVGAGQLGSRHLQAIASMPHVETVYVVEPYAPSRERALERWNEVPGSQEKTLIFRDFSALQAECPAFAAAVISTLATGRLEVLEQVLALGIVSILCEKILFQSVQDYRAAMALSAQHGARIYVNHIYRYIPVYSHFLAHIAQTGAALRMTVMAGNNGLGCNLIHFIDLFGFLTQAPLDTLSVQLDHPLLANKRGEGLVEFTGSAAISAGEHRLEVRFAGADMAAPIITMLCGQHEAVLDESQTSFTTNIPGISTHLELPRTSTLTAQILTEMLQSRPLLPTLEESFDANRRMLLAFNQALTLGDAESIACPIT